VAPRLARFAPLIGFLVGGAAGWPRLPAPVGDAPPDRFSGERALAHVRTWASAPRPSGSARHAEVLDALEASLVASGLEVTRHPFTTGKVRGVNLVATAPGADDRDGVWLVAHSDSAPRSPGAADDGFGLAVVVEAARALSAGGPPPGLKVLLTDAEELGLHGARAEVGRVPEARRVVINVEARGASGPVYMFQTAGPPDAVLGAWRRSGCRAQATSLARTVYELLPNDTDFTVFRRAGWAGYDFALIHDAWRYHSPDDVPEGLDPGSVQQAGDCVTGLARAWLEAGGVEALGGGGGDGARPVYAQLAGPTMVVPGVLAQVLGLGALGLALAPGATGRGGRVRGAVAWLVAAGLCVAAGFGLLALYPHLRADFWERAAEAPGAGGRFVGLALVGAAIPALVLAVARRRGPAERGWHGVGVGLAAAAAFWEPAAGYLLLPGAYAGALALRGRPVAAGLAAVLAGLLLAPVLQAIYPALGSRAAPVLAVLPLLLLGWLAPPPPAAR